MSGAPLQAHVPPAHSAHPVQRTHETSIDAILAMMQARDPHASSHARRVARLSVNLALALHVEEPILSDIERAALLHDVGRLAMPDEVLSAPAESLAPGERALLRAHPVHAAHTVATVHSSSPSRTA